MELIALQYKEITVLLVCSNNSTQTMRGEPNESMLLVQFQALPAQMTWTQGEDELLATGLLRFGQDWSRISLHVMPVKTVAEMRDRQKNRCHRVEGNCIRVSVHICISPSKVCF